MESHRDNNQNLHEATSFMAVEANLPQDDCCQATALVHTTGQGLRHREANVPA